MSDSLVDSSLAKDPAPSESNAQPSCEQFDGACRDTNDQRKQLDHQTAEMYVWEYLYRARPPLAFGTTRENL